MGMGRRGGEGVVRRRLSVVWTTEFGLRVMDGCSPCRFVKERYNLAPVSQGHARGTLVRIWTRTTRGLTYAGYWKNYPGDRIDV